MNDATIRARLSESETDSAERPQVHTNGGTFLIYPDGHVITVTNERYEEARRALARCTFEDPRPAAQERAKAAFRRAEDECFREFGLIRRGAQWVFADTSTP